MALSVEAALEMVGESVIDAFETGGFVVPAAAFSPTKESIALALVDYANIAIAEVFHVEQRPQPCRRSNVCGR